MALQDRIHSLETEYAITFYADNGNNPGPGAIIDVLMEAVRQSHGVHSSIYLLNGSKLAHDVGHAEWSQPECRSARELAMYDKAADHLFANSVVPRAEKVFLREGFSGRLAVVKNNTDGFGHTYGCHENYQMLRDTDLMGNDTFLRYIAQSMVPFLVSRQIFAGSGRFESGETQRDRRAAPLRYEISQRGAFIETVVSGDTTRARPIFNLGREGESFSTHEFRRVHLVLGDANVSGWATWVKMGSTGLVLRLVEDLFVSDIPILQDPVSAVRVINQDLTGRKPVALQGGGQVTALDIQWAYYDLANRYLDIFGTSQEDEDLMEAWGKALEDFEQDPMRLRDRADWAIKKQLIDTFLAQHNYTLDNLPADRNLINDLKAFDLQYHELSDQGLYNRMYQPDNLVTEDEILWAQDHPPQYTRARIRGEVVRLGRDGGLDVRADGWTRVMIEGERISIDEPLVFDHIRLARWDRPWLPLEAQLATLSEQDQETESDQAPNRAALHYKLGCCYRDMGQHSKALPALRTAAEQEPNDVVYGYDLARALLHTGHYADAIQQFEKYNRLLNNDDATGDEFVRDYVSVGDAYRFQGDYAAALEQYQHAIKANTRLSETARRNIALVHLKQGDINAARTHFQQSIRLTVERLVSLVGLGAILLANGDRKAAAAHLTQAAALSDTAARFGLTPVELPYFRALAAVGLEHDGALDQLRAALENQTPEAAGGLFALEPLINLMAQADPPLKDIAAAQELVNNASPLVEQPDSDAPPPVEERRVRWLTDALNSSTVHLRREALTYLGWRAPDSPLWTRLVTLVLDKAHNDPDATVRRAAVQILGRPGLPVPDHTEELIKRLHDDSPAVRWAAQTSLEHLSQPYIPLFDEAEEPTPDEPLPPFFSGRRGLSAPPGSRRRGTPGRPGGIDEPMDPMEWLQSLAERQSEPQRRQPPDVDNVEEP